MLRIFILVILFFTFSSMSHGKVFDKKKCEEILKKYDVSYQSWNNILNRYLKEREKLMPIICVEVKSFFTDRPSLIWILSQIIPI